MILTIKPMLSVFELYVMAFIFLMLFIWIAAHLTNVRRAKRMKNTARSNMKIVRMNNQAGYNKDNCRWTNEQK